MSLKLYIDAMSQPCRSVMMLLRCTNIAYTTKIVNIAQGGTRSDEFKKLHPFGKVPVIDDDGHILSESCAILRYLCNTRDVADHWYPKDPQKRSKIEEYLAWHHQYLRMGAAFTIFESTLKPMMTGKPGQDIERYVKILNMSIGMFENYFLSKTDFISSDELSIADLMAVTEFSQLEVMGEKLPAKLTPKLLDWKQRCIDKTEPHYSDVHKIMFQVRDMILGASKL